MTKSRRSKSSQTPEDGSESASVDTADIDLAVMRDDTPMAVPVDMPKPVTKLHEVEIDFNRYTRTGKSRSLVAAFRADMQSKDKFRVVKRTRTAWDKLWDEFLKAPR